MKTKSTQPNLEVSISFVKLDEKELTEKREKLEKLLFDVAFALNHETKNGVVNDDREQVDLVA